jgi:excisionase family DNA binding protein
MTTPSNLQLPSAHDAKLAKASMKAFKHLKNNEVELRVEQETVRVPLTAVKLLQRILSQMAQGNAVTITPIKNEITTQEAADVLNVSRPYLIGLLENKTIASRKVGTHRRVPLKALLEYKAKSRAAAEEALQELADLSQELGLGY